MFWSAILQDGEGYVAHGKDLSTFVNDNNTVDAIPGILSGLVSRDDLESIGQYLWRILRHDGLTLTMPNDFESSLRTL